MQAGHPHMVMLRMALTTQRHVMSSSFHMGYTKEWGSNLHAIGMGKASHER